MNSFTPDQNNTIDARNCNMIVSAAAGSGKTAVIIERLTRMLTDEENKLPVDRIVVVTFTNDAAAQMKQRLNAAFEKLLAENPDNDWISSQQAALSDAKISTVHAFCFNLLRENSDKLEFPADFRIIDETEMAVIENRAIGQVITEYCETAPQALRCIDDFFFSKDTSLNDIIIGFYHSLLNIPRWEEWLSEYVGNLNPDAITADSDFVKKYISCLTEDILSASMNLRAAIDYVAETCPDCKMASILSEEYEMASTAISKLRSDDYSFDEKFAVITSIPSNMKRADHKDLMELIADPEEIENLKDTIKGYRDAFKSCIKKDIIETKLLTLDEIKEDIAIHRNILMILKDVVIRLDEVIHRKKLDLNGLSFSDAEHLTIALLSERDDNGKYVQNSLCRELSEHYRQIVIDEYQDTNNVQEEIFRLLSYDGKKLFVVGDIKQSIYGFRGANPDIFRERFNTSEKYDNLSVDDAYVKLSKNFRSSEAVVEFTNHIFRTIMNGREIPTPYTTDDELVFGAEHYRGESRITEVLVCEDLEDNEEKTPVITDESDSENDDSGDIINEASIVASRIKQLLDAKTKVKERDGERICTPGDFCIILRKKSHVTLFADELAKHGIKAVASEVNGYLKSREISVLINFLKIIDNPLRDIPLASVLMSPLFTLTKEDMLKIRSFKKGELYRDVTEALRHECDEPWYIKLKKFSESYNRLRVAAAGCSVEQLINTIYDSTDFLAIVRVYADGAKKRANLRLLLSYAKSYEESKNGGLSGFLRHLDNISESGKDLAQASVVSGSEDAVSIKTIHKSKGLEYPFVFVCMLGTEFVKKDLRKRIIVDRSEEGIALKIQKKNELKLYDSVMGYMAKKSVLSDLVNEEMRLLYVALTRAKQKLFITLSINNKSVKKLKKIAAYISATNDSDPENIPAPKINSMSEWIFSGILKHPDSEYLRNTIDFPLRDSSSEFSLEYTVNTVEKFTDKNENRKYAKPDKAIIDEIKKNISFRYDDRLSKTASKLTVTEISHSSADEITLTKPKFTYSDGKLTGAEMGTATHLFMQYCDFALAEKDIITERDRLRDNGILGLKESSAIEVGKLEAFFSSELYKRMKKATATERERKFLIRIDDLSVDGELADAYRGTDGMLQGVADCIFFEEDEMVLVDYKTDRHVDEKKLSDTYGDQLRLYKAALEKIYGRKVKETVIYSFWLGKEIIIK